MARRGTAQTLTVHVYSALRDDITGGNLAPGGRLRVSNLAQRFEVSVAVVREALARLTAEGMVQVAHNRGFHVAPLSKQALTDLVEIRRVNEAFALRLAIRRGDLTWESEVLGAHHRLERTAKTTADEPNRRSDEWSEAHRRFHATLLAGCGNEQLIEICRRLSDSGEPYRSLTTPEPADVDAAHRELKEAALARDADRAAALCEQHIQWTADMLLNSGLLDHAADGPGSSGAGSGKDDPTGAAATTR